jgi:tetratricopeptide (TPR) repeat protein
MSGEAARRAPDHEAMAERLAAYQLGALPEPERTAFEEHALRCDVCFEELERGAAAIATLRRDPSRFRAALGEDAARDAAERPRPPRWALLLRPAALVPLAAVAVLAVVLLRRAPERDVRDLAAFPLPAAGSSLVRGGAADDAVRELLQAGLAHLELDRPEEAERRFRAAFSRDPASADAAFLLGLALARRGETGEAIPLLEEAVRRGDAPPSEDVLWTLANAYLKAGRLPEARATLEELSALAGVRSDAARRLLAQLAR